MAKFFVAYGVADPVTGYWVEATSPEEAAKAIQHVDQDDYNHELAKNQVEMQWVFYEDGTPAANSGFLNQYDGETIIPFVDGHTAISPEHATVFDPDGNALND